MENAQERHKRYQRDEGVIVRDALAFGPIAAMDKHDVRSVLTIEKMMKRRCNGPVPIIDKPALYPSSESYCQGVVKGIIFAIEELKNTVSNLENLLAGKDAIIAEKDKRIKQLQHDRQSFGELGRQKEDTLMQELLNQVKVL